MSKSSFSKTKTDLNNIQAYNNLKKQVSRIKISIIKKKLYVKIV